MSPELKAMLVVLFKSVALVKDLVAKAGVVQDMQDLEALGLAVPPVVSGFSDLMPEIKALGSVQVDADLLAFVVSQVAGVNSDAHAQAIISAALDLAVALGEKGMALEQAIAGS